MSEKYEPREYDPDGPWTLKGLLSFTFMDLKIEPTDSTWRDHEELEQEAEN